MRLLLAIIAISVMAPGCAKQGRSTWRDGATRRALYEQHCAACHGPNGDGNPLGGARAPSLRSEHARGQTDEALFNWVKRGGSNMPSFKQALTDEQIRELVRYLREEIQEQSVAGAIACHAGA